MAPNEDEGRPEPQEERGSSGGRPEELTPEERRFVEELLRRNEAAEPAEGGELPDEATHEIVERPPDRPPVVRRRRFTLE